MLNYGFVKNWEAIAEFRLQASPELEITDPGVSLKAILKEGVLQKREGVSVAIEAGLLLPSTVSDERRLGAQAIGAVSGEVAPVTLHVNGGGGLDRDHRGFVSWGIVGELPVHPKLRLVAEVNGTGTLGRQPDNSGLVGVLWQPMSRKLVLDAGVRRGFGGAAPDWQFTLGLTFGFPLAAAFPR